MENEEVIRRRMEETRESLTEKLETLENKLLGSVDQATSAVRETVANVKETMHEGVESVKDAVDIPAHVRRRPWMMLGGAVFGGYVLGSLLTRQTETPRRQSIPSPPPKHMTVGNGHHKPPTEESASEPRAGLLDAFEPELRRLKGLALGVTFGTIREVLTKELPPHLAEQLRSVIDDVTTKVGGNPIASADLPFLDPALHQQEESSSFGAEKPRW